MLIWIYGHVFVQYLQCFSLHQVQIQITVRECVCVSFNVSVRDQFMLQRLVVGCTGSTLIVRSDGTTANMFSHPGYVTSLRKHILNTLSTDTERLKLFHSAQSQEAALVMCF